MAPSSLNHHIASFYDASSGLWEQIWGEHMHHGYYGPDGSELKDHYQAQVDLIDELLNWADVNSASRILDLGCGIGGSALLLADRFEAEVEGLTLSPVQAERANTRAVEAGFQDHARFHVADAMQPPFEPGGFDLVWSLESGEHMPDKPRFLQVCADQLAPGGRLIMATWCHRTVPPPLSAGEERFLDQLYAAYHLPYIVSIEDYADLARTAGFTDVTINDWTEAVAPFWNAVLQSALRPSGLAGLARSGWTTIRGALSMRYMIQGYRSGLIRFGVLHAVKE